MVDVKNILYRNVFTCFLLLFFCALHSAFAQSPTSKEVIHNQAGVKIAEGLIVDGKYEGLWVFWDEKGRLRKSGIYEHGVPAGAWTEYEKGGKHICIGAYVDLFFTPPGSLAQDSSLNTIESTPSFDDFSPQATSDHYEFEAGDIYVKHGEWLVIQAGKNKLIERRYYSSGKLIRVENGPFIEWIIGE